MTRGNVMPSEDAVAAIESQFPGTKTAALARILRARIKLNAKDFAGAADLLGARIIRDHSVLGDYALFLRASAFEQGGRLAESRATYLQLLNEYPKSLRARDAALRAASLFMKNGEAAAVPLLLKDFVKIDDGDALLAAAKAHEQASDQTRALAM